MRLRRRRGKPSVDRDRFPYDYVGPSTAWGLTPNTPCRILGRGIAGGGRRIITPAGRRWTVHVEQLQRKR